MGEKDCVSLFVDIFKWGVVVLVAVVGWMLSGDNVLDWPPDDSKGYAVRIVFLAFSVLLWGGWALVLERVRERARSLAPDSDFLGSVGLAQVHWVFCGIAWAGAWYIVFDSSMASRASLVTLSTFAVLLSAMIVTRGMARSAAPRLELR